ncbi:unnamed protein product, partial [Didymodactylos carnosus]
MFGYQTVDNDDGNDIVFDNFDVQFDDDGVPNGNGNVHDDDQDAAAVYRDNDVGIDIAFDNFDVQFD